METLSDEVWDIVIAGTSLPQSLLALSLSKSGKKILHVDRNSYYGGHDAGFNLQDADTWSDHLKTDGSHVYSKPSIYRSQHSTSDQPDPALASSRSYALSLKPQIIYAQSTFLPTLVSSQIHTQLEFLAVGSWWVLRDGALQKIPSSREDVFSDDTLSLRDKRSLMKLMRVALQSEPQDQTPPEPSAPQTLRQSFEERFNIPPSLQTPILALALSSDVAAETDSQIAMRNIQRHMRSIGYFGPGFGAVIAKYGGNAEIAQVACRAQAVGGGVYLLGHGIESIQRDQNTTDEKLLNLILSDGTSIRCRSVVGMGDDLPSTTSDAPRVTETETEIFHSISIVSDPLKTLFPATSENGPVPAAAIVLVDDAADPVAPPIYLQVHSEDTGECPIGQCVIYASVKATSEASTERLQSAVDSFLSSFSPDSSPRTLWSLSYTSRQPASHRRLSFAPESETDDQIIIIPESPFSIALEESLLDNIQKIWQTVMGGDSENHTFLRFEEKEIDSEMTV